ncbi:hypothetical protein ACF1G5_01575, partial [Streptomyces coeruleorubidus]|uniref:hypothetical protein n=1 Tax=Streptomyces coeruleorubidus TaxID=116188 RepID=UPI0036F87CF9
MARTFGHRKNAATAANDTRPTGQPARETRPGETTNNRTARGMAPDVTPYDRAARETGQGGETD